MGKRKAPAPRASRRTCYAPDEWHGLLVVRLRETREAAESGHAGALAAWWEVEARMGRAKMEWIAGARKVH